MYRISKYVYNSTILSTRCTQNCVRSIIKLSETIKKDYEFFYSKLPKYVTVDVLVERENSIKQLPYLLTRIVDVPRFDRSLNKHQFLLPAKFNAEQSKMKTNGVEEFLKVLKRIIRKKMSYHELLLLIAGTPKHVINSDDAIYALRTIIRLIPNTTVGKIFIDTTHLNGFNLLIDRLVKIGEPHEKLEALQLLTMDFRHVQGIIFRDKMLNSIIADIFEGMFSLRFICETMALLSKFNKIPIFREKLPLLWIGLEWNEQFIDRSNILFLLECVEYLPHSRAYIISLVNKHIREHWKTFEARHITQMMDLMRNYATAAKWCDMHVYTLSSDSLEDILKYFIDFQVYDESIVKAIERYLKARSQVIDDASLFMRISEYLKLFRLRNPIILDHLSEVIINRIYYFAPYVVKDIITSFGYLSYHPNTETMFWKTLEEYVIKKFYRIRPDDLMKILMNFIYLGNYTLIFKPKLFNPEYLNKFLQTSAKRIKEAKNSLYVYDMALTLENKNYNGPLLSSDRKIDIPYDTEVRHFILRMERYFNLVFDKHAMDYSRFIRLEWLPNSPLYILDIIAYPKGLVFKKSSISSLIQTQPDKFLVVLIVKPTHLTHDHILIGPQQMRIRHLLHFGIPVSTINGALCMDFKNSHQETLQYLEERIFNNKHLPFTKA